MTRKEKIQSIRPKLQLSLEAKSEDEKFQNTVLRPILKFQNNLLLGFFQGSKQFQQQLNSLDKTNERNFENGIKDFLRSNNKFRNKCLAMVMALMTVEELNYFLENESEFNRRILNMLVHRIAGQIN